MNQVYVEDKTFEKVDFTTSPLPKGEYEYCKFISCDFSNVNLSGIKFLECEFKGCNLSLAQLSDTAFRDIKFMDSKMLGLQFNTCNDFGFSVYFENCNLNHSSFYQLKLKKTIFKEVHLNEVDFSSCDLTSAVFNNCNLLRAKFAATNIEKADFRTSYNYSIDPDANRIKKAKFSLNGVVGLLEKYDIDIDPKY